MQNQRIRKTNSVTRSAIRSDINSDMKLSCAVSQKNTTQFPGNSGRNIYVYLPDEPELVMFN